MRSLPQDSPLSLCKTTSHIPGSKPGRNAWPRAVISPRAVYSSLPGDADRAEPVEKPRDLHTCKAGAALPTEPHSLQVAGTTSRPEKAGTHGQK